MTWNDMAESQVYKVRATQAAEEDIQNVANK